MIRRRQSRISDPHGEIAPDEVLLDSSNLPQFDTERFEGRIEQPITRAVVTSVGAAFLLILGAFLIRLYDFQISRGEAFAAQSTENRLRHSVVFANRGVIYDRNQVPLAWNVPPGPDGEYALRYYAAGESLSHLVGYAKPPKRDASGAYYSTRYEGSSGVEKAFDGYLAGTNGTRIVETDALDEVRSESIFSSPVDGRSLSLAVDADVSEHLYDSIKALAERVGFRGGAGVIMDVRTGEILALTSYPGYSPIVMSAATDTEAIRAYQSSTKSPFLNRAVDGLYTPGSIVKPFIALAALEKGVIDPNKQILSTGALTVENPFDPSKPSIFRDWKAHGWVDMREAIAVSSNVYFFEVGGGFEGQQGLGIDAVSAYLRRFGFGEVVPGDLFSREAGVVPDPAWKAVHYPDEPWRLGDTYNTSIGQYSFQVTAMQVVRATAAIANGGTLVTPTLVREGNVFRADPGIDIGIPKEHLSVVKEGMRQAATRGTAAALNIPDVTVAAKTGTAELGVQKEYVNSWVTGYFPYEEPRYAFAVIMERGPRANLYGAVVAMREFLLWLTAERPSYVEFKE